MKSAILAMVLLEFILALISQLDSKYPVVKGLIRDNDIPNKLGITKFVIFSNEHMGSTYLCDLINRHPSIEMRNDLFNLENSPFTRIVHQHQMSNSIFTNRRRNPKVFLDKVWSLSSGNNRTSAVGFKIFHNHLDWSVVENLLILDHSIKKIILIRSDILSVYVSYTLALESKRWSKLDTSHIIKEVDVTAFEKYKDTYIHWFHMILSRLRLTRQKYVLLEYNHDLDNASNVRHTLDSIQSFLGVSRTDPDIMLNSTTFIKQASSGAPIEQRISNWESLPESVKAYANNTSASVYDLIGLGTVSHQQKQ
eukprot:gene8499-17528_t